MTPAAGDREPEVEVVGLFTRIRMKEAEFWRYLALRLVLAAAVLGFAWYVGVFGGDSSGPPWHESRRDEIWAAAERAVLKEIGEGVASPVFSHDSNVVILGASDVSVSGALRYRLSDGAEPDKVWSADYRVELNQVDPAVDLFVVRATVRSR